MKRTPIRERKLPDYSRGEEIANMVTHIIGGGAGIIVLVAAVLISAKNGGAIEIAASAVYGFSIIALYTVSSVYHGLLPSFGKKVMQAVDHCTIYLLIAGTYTPILLIAMRKEFPFAAWGVFAAEWALAVFGAVFTAIDHNRYRRLSMVFYLLMGWFIILALPQTVKAVSLEGMLWIFFGGVSYTVGAVIYSVGKGKPYYHTVFHVFVVAGTLLQAFGIIRFVL